MDLVRCAPRHRMLVWNLRVAFVAGLGLIREDVALVEADEDTIRAVALRLRHRAVRASSARWPWTRMDVTR